jgi:hypothetical protein
MAHWSGSSGVVGRVSVVAGVSSGIGIELGPATGKATELHGFLLCHAWIQFTIPVLSTVRVDDRALCRTEPISMTSSKSMRRASSRLSGCGLRHSSKRAGRIHPSMLFLRAKMSFFKGSRGLMQRMAKSRMPVKPHRVERSRIADHSSKVRLSRVL